MPRFHPSPALRTVCSTTALLLCLTLQAAAAPKPKPHHPGDPDVSLALDDLGFEPALPRLLTTGATMFTVHYVDDTHLLLTYNTHGLLARLPDVTPDDDDRLVAAKLIELPSGKVVAQTRWRTRDRLQYLWPLTHGLFLLRVRSTLTVIDPLGHLTSADPFVEQPFLQFSRRIGYASVSPNGDLLTVETVPQPHFQKDSAASLTAIGAVNTQNTAPKSATNPADAPAPPAPPTPGTFTPEGLEPAVEIRFYRLVHEGVPGQPQRLIAQAAGALAAQHMARVPANAAGFLDITQESGSTWLFDFQSHAGPRVELSPYDTACAPSPFFTSATEFVALGCRGDATKLQLSGFNLRGEQPWISVLAGQQISPAIVSAPAAGRFAFSRILLTNSYYDLENLMPNEVSAQEITVYQHHDGRVLLKTQASPIQRAGQNFDLSPNGLGFVVVHDKSLDVYALAKLNEKDQEQLKLASAATPATNDARILLSRPGTEKASAAKIPAAAATDKNVVVVNGNAVQPAVAAPTIPSATAKDPVQTVGDATPDQPRARPSLYTPDHPKPPPL